MNHCETCKHFDHEETKDVWGICLLGSSRDGDPERKESLAVAQDWEGCGAERSSGT